MHTTRGLNEDITFWAPSGSSNDFGVRNFVAPVLIKGRWQDKQEMARTPAGEEFVTQAIVFVDRDTPNGSYLAKGDYTNAANPLELVASSEVRALSKISSIRNAGVERKAFL